MKFCFILFRYHQGPIVIVRAKHLDRGVIFGRVDRRRRNSAEDVYNFVGLPIQNLVTTTDLESNHILSRYFSINLKRHNPIGL